MVEGEKKSSNLFRLSYSYPIFILSYFFFLHSSHDSANSAC